MRGSGFGRGERVVGSVPLCSQVEDGQEEEEEHGLHEEWEAGTVKRVVAGLDDGEPEDTDRYQQGADDDRTKRYARTRCVAGIVLHRA